MNSLFTMRKSRTAEFMTYIWTTPPIFSKAGYHKNAWNLYKMFEQRQIQSRRVSGVHRTSFIFTPQLSIRPIARAAQEDSLFWAVKGLLSCVWSFPHLILKSFNMETQISFFQALKSIQARALATCDQLSQGRENNWACTCFTETHGTWPDINSLIGHAKQFEAFSFVSRNLKCKFFHRAFFDFFSFLHLQGIMYILKPLKMALTKSCELAPLSFSKFVSFFGFSRVG